MAFIPLTGGGSLVDNIIDRFQDEPGFDFIAYTDAQEVTGELFRELIGPDFEPYKDLATYADIEAVQDAIALVDASTNAQQIIAGITETVTGFVIDEPTVNAYTGNDGFILLSITNAISTPEASTLQYRINDGGWTSAASLTADTIDTSYVVIPDLDNNTTYKLDVRQSLFGTQSKVLTLNLTTTPTTENWKSFFSNTSDRDHFYTDSYTDGNTYGIDGKTVMEMILGSEAVVNAIAEDNTILDLMEQNSQNITTLTDSASGTAGLFNSVNGFNHVFNRANQTNRLSYLGAMAASEQAMLYVSNTPSSFETIIASTEAMTAVDNVDLATRILILEQTSTQNYANFTNIADFIDDETAMTEVASSQNAMRALIAGEIAEAELVLEPIALNEVFANLQATLIMANNPTAVEEVANSTTAMNLVDANDELLRIFLLELTNKDYTTYVDINAVFADSTAFTSIQNNANTLNILLNSDVSMTLAVPLVYNSLTYSLNSVLTGSILTDVNNTTQIPITLRFDISNTNLQNTATINANGTTIITLENLSPLTNYDIYAQAYYKELYQSNVDLISNSTTGDYPTDLNLLTPYLSSTTKSSITGGIHMKDDGTRIYTVEGEYVRQYDLTTPFDLSTMSFAGESEFHSPGSGRLRDGGVTLNANGRLLFVGDSNPSSSYDIIFVYLVSTPFDITTKGSVYTFFDVGDIIGGNDPRIFELAFNHDETRLTALALDDSPFLARLDFESNDFSSMGGLTNRPSNVSSAGTVMYNFNYADIVSSSGTGIGFYSRDGNYIFAPTLDRTSTGADRKITMRAYPTNNFSLSDIFYNTSEDYEAGNTFEFGISTNETLDVQVPIFRTSITKNRKYLLTYNNTTSELQMYKWY